MSCESTRFVQTHAHDDAVILLASPAGVVAASALRPTLGAEASGQCHMQVVVAGAVATKALLELNLFTVFWLVAKSLWLTSTMTTSTMTTFA